MFNKEVNSSIKSAKNRSAKGSFAEPRNRGAAPVNIVKLSMHPLNVISWRDSEYPTHAQYAFAIVRMRKRNTGVAGSSKDDEKWCDPDMYCWSEEEEEMLMNGK